MINKLYIIKSHPISLLPNSPEQAQRSGFHACFHCFLTKQLFQLKRVDSPKKINTHAILSREKTNCPRILSLEQWRRMCSIDSSSPLHIKHLFTKIQPILIILSLVKIPFQTNRCFHLEDKFLASQTMSRVSLAIPKNIILALTQGDMLFNNHNMIIKSSYCHFSKLGTSNLEDQKEIASLMHQYVLLTALDT